MGKKNLKDLSEQEQRSIPTIRGLIDTYCVTETFPFQELEPQEIFVIIDAFYRKRGSGIIVFRSPDLQRNLLWYDIKSEKIIDFQYGIEILLLWGWKIKGIIVDGRKGVISCLSQYAPVQHCQFHQIAIALRYLTKKPKSLAAKEMLDIALSLTKTTKEIFVKELGNWKNKHQILLAQKTYHPTGTWSYTHRKLRSCLRSLLTNIPHLFTFQNISKMPNTTNSLDGSISHYRTLIRLHRGAKLSLKRKITQELLR